MIKSLPGSPSSSTSIQPASGQNPKLPSAPFHTAASPWVTSPFPLAFPTHLWPFCYLWLGSHLSSDLRRKAMFRELTWTSYNNSHLTVLTREHIHCAQLYLVFFPTWKIHLQVPGSFGANSSTPAPPSSSSPPSPEKLGCTPYFAFFSHVFIYLALGHELLCDSGWPQTLSGVRMTLNSSPPPLPPQMLGLQAYITVPNHAFPLC